MLKNWDDISDQYIWSLLLGNGFSINIDRDFSYSSLFNNAQKSFSPEVISLFDFFKTTNFEDIMHSLQDSKEVAEIYGRNSFANKLDSEKDIVREALIKAIQSVHTPYSALDNYGSLKKISSELEKYQSVFTTNYDLIPYWAIMSGRTNRFKDFFWHPYNNYFDLGNSDIRGNSTTQIYYLHGALHIFEDDSNDTYKIKPRSNDLLGEVYKKIRRGHIPVFISEGNFKSKYKKIKRSDYLMFCYNELRSLDDDIVVLGHSLTPKFDQHIIKAIQKQNKKKLAIAIHPPTTKNVKFEKARIQDLFPKHDLIFFDSTSHPLGADLSPYYYD